MFSEVIEIDSSGKKQQDEQIGAAGGHKGNGHQSLGCLAEQGWSKVSRYLICKLRPAYVKENLASRGGECLRCARCCAIFFRCPYLKGNQCEIYDKRYIQCRAFPIDARDVNLIKKMGGKCGFIFPED